MNDDCPVYLIQSSQRLLLADISALASRSHIFILLGTKSILSGNTVLVTMIYFILFCSSSVLV